MKHCLSRATDLTLGSLTTLSWVLTLPAPIEAVRVAVTEAPAVVSTVKVALVWPAATTTLAGTAARAG